MLFGLNSSFPLFHWPTFASRIQTLDYTRDRAFFATTMAVCAIVTARLRAGAVIPHLVGASQSFPHSEALASAAVLAFPHTLSKAGSFEYMRAKALLAILFIQYGDVVEHRTHLGEFVVLASNTGLHDEQRWDRDLYEVERQERRRLVSTRPFPPLMTVLVHLYAGDLLCHYVGRYRALSRESKQRSLPRRG